MTIALFGHDEYAVCGIAAVLDLEKVPYRRLLRLGHGGGDLVVVAGADLSPAEIASVGRQPALVLHGGPVFAQQMFGATACRSREMECSIAVAEPVWPASVADLARSFGKSSLRIPLAPVCATPGIAKGTILAMASVPGAAAPQPAIVQLGRCVWCVADLGAAFANLLTENYAPPRHTNGARLAPWVRRVSEGAYYAAPDSLRRWIQRRYYARLERRLGGWGNRASEYPIDATGWLLVELVKRLMTLAVGSFVRIEKWPAPYRAAATVTRDLEPRRFAYTGGLRRLLDRGAAIAPAAALGLVAEASERYLTDEMVGRIHQQEVLCHGLTHRGENVRGRAQVSVSVQTARTRLERRLGRRVAGYRSPRLDRSPDLAWALDHSDFQYDSSYPDVDRENIEHFGGGVRLNVPYRPLVDDPTNGLRPSRCLELPLTAPDCIQPLFAGHDAADLRAAVTAKTAFVRETCGLYVALVHAGVFGERDAAVREAHLDFVCRQLHHADVWLARMDEIAEWWRKREALRLSARDGAVCVANEGTQPVVGARVVIERAAGATVLPVPPLDPGAQVTL